MIYSTDFFKIIRRFFWVPRDKERSGHEYTFFNCSLKMTAAKNFQINQWNYLKALYVS